MLFGQVPIAFVCSTICVVTKRTNGFQTHISMPEPYGYRIAFAIEYVQP